LLRTVKLDGLKPQQIVETIFQYLNSSRSEARYVRDSSERPTFERGALAAILTGCCGYTEHEAGHHVGGGITAVRRDRWIAYDDYGAALTRIVGVLQALHDPKDALVYHHCDYAKILDDSGYIVGAPISEEAECCVYLYGGRTVSIHKEKPTSAVLNTLASCGISCLWFPLEEIVMEVDCLNAEFRTEHNLTDAAIQYMVAQAAFSFERADDTEEGNDRLGEVFGEAEEALEIMTQQVLSIRDTTLDAEGRRLLKSLEG